MRYSHTHAIIQMKWAILGSSSKRSSIPGLCNVLGLHGEISFSTQVVSLSIYGMYGVATDLGMKFHGLQEWPKSLHQKKHPWSAPPKNSSSPNGSSHMKTRDVVWKSWFAHCFSWNMQHMKYGESYSQRELCHPPNKDSHKNKNIIIIWKQK